MALNENLELFEDLYQQYYRKFNGNNNYRLKAGKNNINIKTISNFLNKLETDHKFTVGEVFINEYLLFSFGYYLDRRNKWGDKNVFLISNILSKKVLDNFLNHKGMKYVVTKKSKVRIEYKPAISKKATVIANKQRITIINTLCQFEEKQKARYFNSNKGYFWCADFTSLFNPGSEYCNLCKLKVKCIDRLKENYPQIHQIRINDK